MAGKLCGFHLLPSLNMLGRLHPTSPKLRRGEGVASVANTGLTGGHFRICGNDWSYGRIFGSVAMIGVSDILEEGRGRRRRGEKCCAAGAYRLSGAGYRESRVRIAEAIVLHLDYLSSNT